jgi:DNA polymerase I-like protein with 3'-5' exonuclease and polymerase domains
MKLNKNTLKKLVLESLEEARKKKQTEGAESDGIMGSDEDPNTDMVRSMEPAGIQPDPSADYNRLLNLGTNLTKALQGLVKNPADEIHLAAAKRFAEDYIEVLKPFVKDEAAQEQQPAQVGAQPALPK